MDIERVELAEQTYLYVDRSAELTGEAIASAMESGFGEVIGFFGERKITPVSMPVAVYTEMPGPGRKMAFRAGFFVAPEDAARAAGPVIAGTIPEGPAVKTVHYGSYTRLNETHSALWAAMQDEGMTPDMPVWEVYVDDPVARRADEVRTEVWRAVG
ncbi:GyrI-like domain-containing protein [Henriciella sp.]|uniref:GyrI-like domain-containing protein n=1 Tax=Henriciella sp. TaxID=1968823 RepID=UPI0025BF709B|nr:GyrI-like domain-containing protein [Henriciella sp.]